MRRKPSTQRRTRRKPFSGYGTSGSTCTRFDLDAAADRALYDRGVALSRDIIAGEFERALESILDQLRDPPRWNERPLPAPAHVRRLAGALRGGLMGLPPNGFDFAAWLWEAAPLHDARVPESSDVAADVGFRAGVIFLRTIAAMTAGLYTDQQPRDIPSLVPLLDASVDWVDARALVRHAMATPLARRFASERPFLESLARERPPARKLVALETAARVLATTRSRHDAEALALVRLTLEGVGDPDVSRGIRYALRCALAAGKTRPVAAFIAALAGHTHPELRRAAASCVAGRAEWDGESAAVLLLVLKVWSVDGPRDVREVVVRAMGKVTGSAA